MALVSMSVLGSSQAASRIDAGNCAKRRRDKLGGRKTIMTRGSNCGRAHELGLLKTRVMGIGNKRRKLTVMAIVGGTGFPENSEMSAIACAMPLLGPSFGIDPDGQCTWMLRPCMMLVVASAVSPSSYAWALTQVSATSTLSLST